MQKISKNYTKRPTPIILKNQKLYSVSKRLAARAQTLYLGRTGVHINRTDKLINLLAYDGNRKKIENTVLDVKIRIKEYFLPDSSADFLENILTRLEPMLDVTEVKSFKRKHSNRRQAQLKSYVVTPASNGRRIQLGLGFFTKAVRLTQKRLQFTLATAIMVEIVALCSGLKCHSMRLKRDHLFKAVRFFNRFGTPVALGSKIANRFAKKTGSIAGRVNKKRFLKRQNKPFRKSSFGGNSKKFPSSKNTKKI